MEKYPIISEKPLIVSDCIIKLLAGKFIIIESLDKVYKIPVPISEVKELWAMPNVIIPTQVLSFLAERGKYVYIMGKDGLESFLMPIGTRWYTRGDVIFQQVQMFNAARGYIAQKIVKAIVLNIRHLLNYIKAKKVLNPDYVELWKKELEPIITKIDYIRNVNKLLLKEAEAWQILYGAIADAFPDFTKRVTRPPTDPINSLISYLNSILYGVFVRHILKAGLEPSISYVHSPFGYKRAALSFDLKDIFAPATSIRTAIMIANKWYKDNKRDIWDRFIKTKNGVYLKPNERIYVTKRFFKLLRQKIGGYTYNTWMKKEVIKLREFILRNNNEYNPWIWYLATRNKMIEH